MILPLSHSSRSAVVVDLGRLVVENQFNWASQVYSGSAGEEIGELSMVVVDVMNVSVSTVQLYRWVIEE